MSIHQPDLFDLPILKYIRGSKTSTQAALEIEPRSGTLRAKVLAELRNHPDGLTDDEMQTHLSMNPSTQRPRRIELVEAKLVKDSGRTRLTQSRRQAVVWVAA